MKGGKGGTNENVVEPDAQVEDLLFELGDLLGRRRQVGRERLEKRSESTEELLSLCITTGRGGRSAEPFRRGGAGGGRTKELDLISQKESHTR